MISKNSHRKEKKEGNTNIREGKKAGRAKG